MGIYNLYNQVMRFIQVCIADWLNEYPDHTVEPCIVMTRNIYLVVSNYYKKEHEINEILGYKVLTIEDHSNHIGVVKFGIPCHKEIVRSFPIPGQIYITPSKPRELFDTSDFHPRCMNKIWHDDEADTLRYAVETLGKYEEEPDMRIEKVIYHNPATIVFWKDGTKTVVKKQKGDKYDPEKGLAMAIAKKALGNEGNYYDIFKEHLTVKSRK